MRRRTGEEVPALAENLLNAGSASRREEILSEAVRQLTAELRDIRGKHEAEVAELKATLESADHRSALQAPRAEQASPDSSAAAALAHRTMAKALMAELDNCIRQLERSREAVDRSVGGIGGPRRRSGRSRRLDRLYLNVTAILRHPFKRDKRREFRRNQLELKNRA